MPLRHHALITGTREEILSELAAGNHEGRSPAKRRELESAIAALGHYACCAVRVGRMVYVVTDDMP